ncbi:esterase family protein [Paenibacillus sp. SC116]|uniref:alpha/beta hydrolase n=1 Tax=Paenibacillus sp. SC116 TaxID=2968986 RepID=UPI00215B389D|nr:alpha/beta hydrolase family protein [Paenibacillus sp. SC116]MCR8845382.1 esterase family protein [Paenibacillus sp. SC116]
MANIQCRFYAETLAISTSIQVVLPQHSFLRASRDGKLPVLFLLHGLGADHTEWGRHSSVERLAEETGVALVMPSVGRSYYTDMKKGSPYFTYVSEELPVVARSLFPLSERREDNFVAGISMGGYGAFKLGLSFPERYAAAASLSGGLDIVSRVNGPNSFLPYEVECIFGNTEELKGSENDLFALASELAASQEQQPHLYQCCGTEDFLHKDNLSFYDHAIDVGLDITYEEEPGEHEWGYWDRKIKRVLDWLPL